MTLHFRNVDAATTDDVDTWPYEALVTAIDRGLVADWQPIFSAIRRQPWGRTARRVERFLSYREPDGIGRLFELAIARAREVTEASERAEVATRVRRASELSGLTMGAFAELVGTSASRFSTYASGKVVPSAAMLVRIESTADRARTASSAEGSHRGAPGIVTGAERDAPATCRAT